MRKFALGALVLGSLVLTACGETVNIGDGAPPQGITVSAIGTADVVPDAVQVSLIVSVLAESNEEALAATSDAAQRVREALLEAGVDRADVATQGLSVMPEYDYSKSEEERIIGYRASQVFDVVIRDAQDAGMVIDDVVAAGGDAVSVASTTPIVDDATDGAQAARSDAVEKARAKAEEYADLLDVRLGDLVYLTELSAPSNVAPVARMDTAVESSGPTIDLGTQQVTVTIEVRWKLD